MIEDVLQGAEYKLCLVLCLSFLCDTVLTLDEEGLGKELVKHFLIGGWIFAHEGALWDLLFVRSEACDATSDALLKATKADATVEHDECEESTLNLKFLTPF